MGKLRETIKSSDGRIQCEIELKKIYNEGAAATAQEGIRSLAVTETCPLECDDTQPPPVLERDTP